MKDHIKHRRAQHGPGGLKCPCCCAYPRRKAKAMDARRVRRKLREEDRRESRG